MDISAITGLQAGIATVGTGSQELQDVSVNFPRAYSTAKNLVVFVTPLQNPQHQPTPPPPPLPDCFATTVTSVTPTGFTVNVFRVDTSDPWQQDLQLMWMAFYTPKD